MEEEGEGAITQGSVDVGPNPTNTLPPISSSCSHKSDLNFNNRKSMTPQLKLQNRAIFIT